MAGRAAGGQSATHPLRRAIGSAALDRLASSMAKPIYECVDGVAYQGAHKRRNDAPRRHLPDRLVIQRADRGVAQIGRIDEYQTRGWLWAQVMQAEAMK